MGEAGLGWSGAGLSVWQGMSRTESPGHVGPGRSGLGRTVGEERRVRERLGVTGREEQSRTGPVRQVVSSGNGTDRAAMSVSAGQRRLVGEAGAGGRWSELTSRRGRDMAGEVAPRGVVRGSCAAQRPGSRRLVVLGARSRHGRNGDGAARVVAMSGQDAVRQDMGCRDGLTGTGSACRVVRDGRARYAKGSGRVGLSRRLGPARRGLSRGG